MRSFLTLAAMLVALVLLSACCGGQPTMTVGLPTLQLGQSSVTPTTSVPVPMVPAYSVQAAPVGACAPASPLTAPCTP